MAAYTPSPDVWNPPQAVIDAGNRSQSQYNPYRRIQSGEETQLRVWPAVKRFRDVVMTLFRGFSSGGMKRSPRREPVVGRVRDPHEEGRAIDFMTRNPSVGDPLANWLVLHSNELGIQLVMWRGTDGLHLVIFPNLKELLAIHTMTTFILNSMTAIKKCHTKKWKEE